MGRLKVSNSPASSSFSIPEQQSKKSREGAITLQTGDDVHLHF
jgi:hypothetical protein